MEEVMGGKKTQAEKIVFSWPLENTKAKHDIIKL